MSPMGTREQIPLNVDPNPATPSSVGHLRNLPIAWTKRLLFGFQDNGVLDKESIYLRYSIAEYNFTGIGRNIPTNFVARIIWGFWLLSLTGIDRRFSLVGKVKIDS